MVLVDCNRKHILNTALVHIMLDVVHPPHSWNYFCQCTSHFHLHSQLHLVLFINPISQISPHCSQLCSSTLSFTGYVVYKRLSSSPLVDHNSTPCLRIYMMMVFLIYLLLSIHFHALCHVSLRLLLFTYSKLRVLLL